MPDKFGIEPGGHRGPLEWLWSESGDRQEIAGRVATEYLRFGKVDVVENVRPLKPKLFGNTHF